MTTTFVVPNGYTSELRMVEPFKRKPIECWIITTPGRFFLTVDFTNRRFCAGIRAPINLPGLSLGKRPYSGYGWQQALVDDAIAWARKNLNEP